MVPIEDVLALDEQPNLPGTINEHPNWRRRLPPGGIFATPGREEELTLSVAHSGDAVDRYVEVFDELGRELTR